MSKNFFFTVFFSFIFVSFLQASDEKINQQIFELKTSQDFIQKLNDEKITLIMGQIIQKENEIKDLEKELKEYVNKEDLEKEIAYQNNRIEDINSSVDRFSVSITLFGVLITLIFLFFTGTFFYVSNKKHLDKVDEWIAKNKSKILEPIHKEANELLNNIESKALEFYQGQLKNFKIDDKLNESQEEILKKINYILDKKEEEEYSYADWYSKYLDKKNQYDYKRALFFIKKAKKYALTDLEKASSLIIEISLLNLMKNYNESINVCDELINTFISNNDTKIRDLVLIAIVSKIESNLISNNRVDKLDLEIYYDLVKDDRKHLMHYEMNKILIEAKEKEIDKKVEQWQKEFSDFSLGNWSFNDLKNWAKTFEEKEVKERLLRYIDIFENHNKK